MTATKYHLYTDYSREQCHVLGNRVYSAASFSFTDPQSPFFAVVWGSSNMQMDDNEALYSAINTTISPLINATSFVIANDITDRRSVSTAKNTRFFTVISCCEEKEPECEECVFQLGSE